MKTIKAIMLIAIIYVGSNLTACTPPIKPEPIVITKTVEVTKLPPAELLQIPAKVPAMSASNPSQADAADWFTKFYNRAAQIENQLMGISSFYGDAK